MPSTPIGGIEMRAETLARQACEIEIERLSQPIGKQDQYIAAYGGLRRIRFNKDESVDTRDIRVTPETVAHLEENFTLFYTGIQRRAETILHEQKRSRESPDTSANQGTCTRFLRCPRKRQSRGLPLRKLDICYIAVGS